MFQQLTMIGFDVEAKTFIYKDEQKDDLKTIDQWNAIGFKVASECIHYPAAYVCELGKIVAVYDFFQVDPQPSVSTKVYNKRLQWLDTAVIRDIV